MVVWSIVVISTGNLTILLKTKTEDLLLAGFD